MNFEKFQKLVHKFMMLFEFIDHSPFGKFYKLGQFF